VILNELKNKDIERGIIAPVPIGTSVFWWSSEANSGLTASQ